MVDVEDPFILLVHQGMVEDIFLQDLKTRGVEVCRNRKVVIQTKTKSATNSQLTVECENPQTGETDFFHSNYLVGCDGAHSSVRKSMPGVQMIGEASKAAWGVLDGWLDCLHSISSH